MELKKGKIPSDILDNVVLEAVQGGVKREDVFCRPKQGEDCCALDAGNELVIASTDPITAVMDEGELLGRLAIHINANDIAACGGEAIGVMLTLLLPPGTTVTVLEDIMRGARCAADEMRIEILGGHTEITDAVTRPVISCTIIGKTHNRVFVSSSGAETGQGVVMTKSAGIEGTGILATENECELRCALGDDIVDKAMDTTGILSVMAESRVARRLGATAMHDVTEGGVLGACWELAHCSGKGIEVYADKIPILDATREICFYFGIDPLRLISSGSMLITAYEPEKLVSALNEAGINAAVIGTITENTGKYIVHGLNRDVLDEPGSDELYKILTGSKTV